MRLPIQRSTAILWLLGQIALDIVGRAMVLQSIVTAPLVGSPFEEHNGGRRVVDLGQRHRIAEGWRHIADIIVLTIGGPVAVGTQRGSGRDDITRLLRANDRRAVVGALE